MTSSTDTDQHPEVAEISALTEGLLPPDRTADIRDHLASCALCADVRSSLEEIRGLLGTLPGPVRMPADVAGRIDAALAAEALLDSTAPVAVSRETTALAADTTHVSRETSHTVNAPRAMERPEARPRGSTGPGRGRRARRWRTAVLGTASALAVFGLGGVVFQAFVSPDGKPAQHSAATDTADTRKAPSGFSAAGLESHVRGLLGKTTESGPSNDVGAQSSPNQPMQGSDTTVPACVREGIGRSDSPIAAEQGTYKGGGAYLVVLPHPSDAARVDAYIVDSSCSGRTPQGPGDVLLTRVIPRN
ncbi:hypothetical protein [Streptomyces sp. 8N706]|uniref:hypothetical protein n=1 Tax=Streptomyces sp. 8N706 TaxID=3457416 RepID=UPI003FCF684A